MLVRGANALYPDLIAATGKRDSYFQQVLEPRRAVGVLDMALFSFGGVERLGINGRSPNRTGLNI